MISSINSSMYRDKEKRKNFKITEKRIVTYNPKLAKKQIYEIKTEVKKPDFLKASQGHRSQSYGDCANMLVFTAADKKGK